MNDTAESAAGRDWTPQQRDLAYHQIRVLLLVDAATSSPEHNKKIDGLTKLAKLDFLVRYPALAPQVLTGLPAHADPDGNTESEAPMVRYKYGPWDDRYYPVIGALVGRGLLRYVRGRRGSVALTTTPAGRALAADVAASPEWRDVAAQCLAVIAASAGMTGTALKDAIYANLAPVLDRPHRQVIR